MLQNLSTDEKIRINMISESEFTVQGHGVHTAYKEITAALKERSDTDVEVNSDRHADIVHIQTVGFYAILRLLWPNGKKVVSAHLVPDSFIGSFVGAKYWRSVARMWLKFFYSRADMVLACSGMVQQELNNDMKLKNVELLYNTVDMSQYKITLKDKTSSRKQLNLKESDFVVIGNGQIQPRKRLDTFIAMAKASPDVKFIWIGGMPFKRLGASYSAMQKLINNVPSNITMTGLIPLEEVRKYYAAADVFVLPATQENHPMCVLEAAGAGLPIVLRDIPQYDDTFRGHALLASSDEEFSTTINKLRIDNTYKQEAIKGSLEIANKFDSSEGALKAVSFYRELLSR